MQIATTYEQAVARRYPEPIEIAIAKDASGRHNPITLCWTMRVSHEPPMLAIAIGLTRHSLDAIRHAREFVLSTLSSTMATDAVFHGTKSGRDLDKLIECGTRTQPATQIDSVLLSDAVANFECRLESEHPAGDHVIFVGRVVAAHMNEDAAARRLFALGSEQMGGMVPG